MEKKQPDNMIRCKKDKLALLGTAETLTLTPWEDEEYEIWGVAQVTTYPVFKRANLLFELHQPSYWDDKNILPRIKKFEGPTYMLDKYKQVPRSVKFPIEYLVSKFRRYHTTSISYMLAWAYDSFLTVGKPQHVTLCGIHMSTREEYIEQRPCCEYWIGIMEGAGMDVTISSGGAILSAQGLYGYEGYHPAIPKIRARLDGLNVGIQHWTKQLEEAKQNYWKQQGAVFEAEHWLRQFQTGEMQKGG